jgi:hypothetical protein
MLNVLFGHLWTVLLVFMLPFLNFLQHGGTPKIHSSVFCSLHHVEMLTITDVSEALIGPIFRFKCGGK